MAIDFPDTPSAEQVFTSGDRSWIFEDNVWRIISSQNLETKISNNEALIWMANNNG